MRLLFLTNFYPPVGRGGYEQWCQEVAIGLRNLGHEVVVLTSRHGKPGFREPEPAWIHRELHLEMELASFRNGFQFFTSRRARENENLARLKLFLNNYAPDCILIWGMWNLPRSLPALAENQKPGRVVYYMGDYWPTLPNQFEIYWKVPAQNWVTGIPKFLLKPIAHRILAREKQPSLFFEHVLFPTAFMRDEFRRRGVEPKKTKIIYGAIDTSLYRYQNGKHSLEQNKSLSLLYTGRLTPDKGVHTAIEALGFLVNQRGFDHIHLQIVGTGEPDYEAQLRQIAQRERVESLVDFTGLQPKESMPELYQKADAFLFTSVWPEPFGRVLVEAMASGVVVIGTLVGGTGEILVPDKNALTFHPGDAIGLAKQIKRLVKTPSLRKQLAGMGRLTALEKFDIRRMVGEIEEYLHRIIEGATKS